MKELKKRDQIKIDNDEYTVIRVIKEREDRKIYVVTDQKNMYQAVIFKQKNKVEEKISNYNHLVELNICVPKIIKVDKKQGIILKEYLEGTIASVLILRGELEGDYLEQVRDMAEKAETADWCLDYFPTNYICSGKRIYYLKNDIIKYQENRCFDNLVHKYWMEHLNVYS